MVVPGQTVTNYLKTDRAFDPGNLAGSALALQAGIETIRFAVLADDERRCIALGDFRNNKVPLSAGFNEQVKSFGTFLDGVLEAVPWLTEPFVKNRVAWEGPSSTLVPSDLLVEGETWEYLSFSHRIEAGETVLSDRMKEPSAFNIFSVPEKIRESLAERFRPAGIRHHSTAFIAGALADHAHHQGKPVLYAYLWGQVIDLVFIDRDGLKFQNRFTCSSPEDGIYYILYVLQQFTVDPAHARVFLTGGIMEGDRLFSLLGKYVGHPSIPGSVHDIHLHGDLSDAPVHQWFTVLNLFRCGS